MPQGQASGVRRGARFVRKHRLLRHADFDRVYQQGRRQFSAHMTLFFLGREGGDPGPRVGFTVGRVMGGAVLRNRIKRRLREAVRHNLERLTLAVDVVINPKKSALEMPFPELCDEVAAGFAAIAKKSRTEAGRNNIG